MTVTAPLKGKKSGNDEENEMDSHTIEIPDGVALSTLCTTWLGPQRFLTFVVKRGCNAKKTDCEKNKTEAEGDKDVLGKGKNPGAGSRWCSYLATNLNTCLQL